MFESIVGGLLVAAGVYFLAGGVFAAVYHSGPLARVDPAVRQAGVVFRVLITAGLAALWPVMLAKWRRAVRGGEPFGEPDRPVTPRRIRRIHGVAVGSLSIAIPLLVLAALINRPSVPIMAGGAQAHLKETAPLGEVLAMSDKVFAELPILTRLRGDGQGRRQLELVVERDLEAPTLALFWVPAESKNEFLKHGVFLGSVWGPGTRRYALPPRATPENGELILYSMSRGEVAARGTLPR